MMYAGGENDQSQECHEHQQTRHRSCEHDLEVHRRRVDGAFVNKERGEQCQARCEQPDHERGIEPIQAVALIECGIDQRQADPTGSEAEPIGSGWLGTTRLRVNTEVQAQRHRNRERHVLPVDPLPGSMIDVPALQRGGNIERHLEVQRIDGDSVGPDSWRHVPQDEAQCERHEEAGGQAGSELQPQQHIQVGGKRLDQADHGECNGGLEQHTARSEHRPEPDRDGGDEHLCGRLGSGNPGALVETRSSC